MLPQHCARDCGQHSRLPHQWAFQVAKGMTSRARFKSQLCCHQPAHQLQMALSLAVLICKTKTITIPTSKGWYEGHVGKYLECMQHLVNIVYGLNKTKPLGDHSSGFENHHEQFTAPGNDLRYLI